MVSNVADVGHLLYAPNVPSHITENVVLKAAILMNKFIYF